jgi:hypothetical protein
MCREFFIPQRIVMFGSDVPLVKREGAATRVGPIVQY